MDYLKTLILYAPENKYGRAERKKEMKKEKEYTHTFWELIFQFMPGFRNVLRFHVNKTR